MKNKTPYHVIFISVDAVSKTDTEKLLSLPSFKYLKENGVFTNEMTTVYPTITYPIHVSAITGRYPDRHAILHNKPWQPDVEDKMRKWFWSLSEIGTETLWHAAARKHLKVASLLWPVSGSGYGTIKWDFPEIMPLPGENPTIKMAKYASPLWLAKTELKYGSKVRPSTKREHMDDYMTFLIERLLEQGKIPDLITVHFADTDDTRHDFGVGGAEDDEAFTRMDKRISRIIEAVKKRGIFDETVFVVMSDHGHENVVNGYFPLDENLLEAGVGRAQSTGMGAFVYPLTDGEEGIVKLTTFLKENADKLHIEKVLEADELRELHAPKGVKVAVNAASGWGYIDKNSDTVHVGDHGFGSDHETAKAFLFLCGKPFVKEKIIDEVRVVDIAPTIAKIMRLDLKDVDGRVLTESFE